MHELEPFYAWRNLYASEEDQLSPFYGREYSEFFFTKKIYNYLIHPQWDDFGSETLYLKVLFADYTQGFTVIEFIGEWNDAINNDIMFLKRDVIENMLGEGINKFIIIGENVLNYHASDDCYYEEWFQEVEEGWIVGLNFQEHVIREFTRNNIDFYIGFGGEFDTFPWRTFTPQQLFERINGIIGRRLA